MRVVWVGFVTHFKIVSRSPFAIADGRVHLWAGGGIVWDSDPEAEIEESWVKARPLLARVGGLVGGVGSTEPLKSAGAGLAGAGAA